MSIIYAIKMLFFAPQAFVTYLVLTNFQIFEGFIDYYDFPIWVYMEEP